MCVCEDVRAEENVMMNKNLLRKHENHDCFVKVNLLRIPTSILLLKLC